MNSYYTYRYTSPTSADRARATTQRCKVEFNIKQTNETKNIIYAMTRNRLLCIDNIWRWDKTTALKIENPTHIAYVIFPVKKDNISERKNTTTECYLFVICTVQFLYRKCSVFTTVNPLINPSTLRTPPPVAVIQRHCSEHVIYYYDT